MFHHRSIGEWYRGEMSSRELLVLIEELPEKSKFKEARDRTYRVVRHEGEMKVFTPYGTLPDDVELVAENIVDWTKAEHVAARIARELAVANSGEKADFTGLIPPLEEWAEGDTVQLGDEQFEQISSGIEAQLNRKAVR